MKQNNKIINLNIIKYLNNVECLSFDNLILYNLTENFDNLIYLNYKKWDSELYYNSKYLLTLYNKNISSSGKYLTLSRIIFKDLNFINLKYSLPDGIICNKLTSKCTLNNLTKIGDYFLYNSKITLIDLTCFSSVNEIGYDFLLQNQLTSIDLSPLTNLTKIGDFFLAKNYITEIDLSPLVNLTTIGDRFLVQNNLTSVNLNCLKNLKEIGKFFLAYNKLNLIDLSHLQNSTKIDVHFLYGNPIHPKIENIKRLYPNIRFGWSF